MNETTSTENQELCDMTRFPTGHDDLRAYMKTRDLELPPVGRLYVLQREAEHTLMGDYFAGGQLTGQFSLCFDEDNRLIIKIESDSADELTSKVLAAFVCPEDDDAVKVKPELDELRVTEDGLSILRWSAQESDHPMTDNAMSMGFQAAQNVWTQLDSMGSAYETKILGSVGAIVFGKPTQPN